MLCRNTGFFVTSLYVPKFLKGIKYYISTTRTHIPFDSKIMLPTTLRKQYKLRQRFIYIKSYVNYHMHGKICIYIRKISTIGKQ